MPKYTVLIPITGTILLNGIEAKTEDEAIEAASEMVVKFTNEEMLVKLDEWDIDEYREIEVEEEDEPKPVAVTPGLVDPTVAALDPDHDPDLARQKE
jgi:hypothetical protein